MFSLCETYTDVVIRLFITKLIFDYVHGTQLRTCTNLFEPFIFLAMLEKPLDPNDSRPIKQAKTTYRSCMQEGMFKR